MRKSATAFAQQKYAEQIDPVGATGVREKPHTIGHHDAQLRMLQPMFLEIFDGLLGVIGNRMTDQVVIEPSYHWFRFLRAQPLHCCAKLSPVLPQLSRNHPNR
jgi:hypothetical protein